MQAPPRTRLAVFGALILCALSRASSSSGESPPRDTQPGMSPGQMTEGVVRFPGRCLLDSAESVSEKARAEFTRFLSELVVE